MEEIKVMLIDDEPAVRKIVKQVIPWEKYHMVVAGEAASGSEALNTMESIEPELILVDIKMPFMDGIEFSRIALEQNPALCIIMLTAYDEFDLARECLRLGVRDYFLKPVNTGEIEEKLQALEKEILDNRRKKQFSVELDIRQDQDVIFRIQAFIYENYWKKELNVAYLANEFNFNPSYLSRMYKKETGELLVDTILKVRMEMAKRLAKDGKKMYMAALETGIPDSNYFGKCFRKYTGMSYSAYQKEG